MDKKRPQLDADDLGRLRWGLGALLALLGVATVFFMEIDAWLLMAAVSAAALAALVRPTWPARVPALVHRLAFPFIALAFVWDLTRTQEPLPALIRLDLLLIFYRLITYRQRRDDLQLVVLVLFLVIVAGVITVSLSFAVQLLAFTGCALVMLLAVTLEYADGTAPSPSPPGTAPGWTRGSWAEHARRLQAATDWRLAALGVGAFTALVVVSGLLFLAIPRFDLQGSLFIDQFINRTTRTGFSDHIRFGEVNAITQDDSLALSIDLTDPSAMPAMPYWRMVVLDEYTGEGFRMSESFRRTLNARSDPRVRTAGTARFSPGAPVWTFYMEPGISRFLPLLGDFVNMSFTAPQSFAVSDPLRVVALQRDPPKMFAYRTWGMDTTGTGHDATFALARQRGEPVDRPFLALPEAPVDRDRLLRVLDAIGAQPEAGAAEFSAAVLRWLERTHPYALNSTVPGGEGQALLRWLDSEAAGHCELFAGSFVLLARAAGHPARLVTGFRGGAWNEFSGSYTVRNSHAHAWSEIFDAERNVWLRVDPTPGNQAQAIESATEAATALAAGRDGSWRARLDGLRVFWYRRIVNFDLDTQAQLLSSTKRWFSDTSRRIIAWADARAAGMRGWMQQPWNPGRWTGLVVIAALVGGMIWFWRRTGARWWLSLRRRTGRGAQPDPVRREAGRWLRRARNRPGFTWPEDLGAALLRLRFGEPSTWPEPIQVFRAARTALRR